MLTGVEPDADVVEMGFDECLVKPVEADDLPEVVERLLTRSSAGLDVNDRVLDVLGDPKTGTAGTSSRTARTAPASWPTQRGTRCRPSTVGSTRSVGPT